LVNLFSPIKLPKEGDLLGVHYLYCFYVKDNDPLVASALLDDALSGVPQGEVLMAGVDQADPLNSILMSYKGRREYGRHYIVCYDDAVSIKGITKFEVARV